MVKMDDHRGKDGYIDWKSYHKAQEDNGEICYICKKYNSDNVVYGNLKSPSMCYDCRQLRKSSGRVDHDNQVRCPKCSHVQSAISDDYGCVPVNFGDESLDVRCESCDHEYSVGVSFTIHLTSPELEPEEDMEEEE